MAIDSRDEFLSNVRRALGREEAGAPVPPEATGLSATPDDVASRADEVRREMERRGDALMSEIERTAAEAGWQVVRVASIEEAAQYVRRLAVDTEAQSVLRSTHQVFEGMNLEGALEDTAANLEVMALGDEADEAARSRRRGELRQQAIEADIGVTGVDYAIAETGTCVLLPRKGVSRVVSLLPPVHVAVVEKGQVLPSLDELFTLRRQAFYEGGPDGLGSYMNLITGPSRSADIEYTLVTGVHGPGEVHMVLVG